MRTFNRSRSVNGPRCVVKLCPLPLLPYTRCACPAPTPHVWSSCCNRSMHDSRHTAGEPHVHKVGPHQRRHPAIHVHPNAVQIREVS
jgi:hypothetical protein